MPQTQTRNDLVSAKETADIVPPDSAMPSFRGAIETRRVGEMFAIRFSVASDFLGTLANGDIQRLFIANFPGQGLQLTYFDEKLKTIYETNLNAGAPGSSTAALMQFDFCRAVELASKRSIELVDGLCRLFFEKQGCFICFQPDYDKKLANQSASYEQTLESWKRLLTPHEQPNTAEISCWNRDGLPTTLNHIRNGINHIINLPADVAATLQNDLASRGFRVRETTESEPWVKLLTKYS